ncbi:uncharacterized protein EV154DRAFT_488493 [Mucor mucedo]|uniref:uncharacterized protein n=1 Tax=Mucor mucedo TaxID=29922 RepID=UPI00221FCD12|nr:uncharacterized protein EV154DRAFT_488493 [Mucor mucedo]KAI7866681.1 hypothetical protein EV154DRAFT_488493 [Mucor mucedo]
MRFVIIDCVITAAKTNLTLITKVITVLGELKSLLEWKIEDHTTILIAITSTCVEILQMKNLVVISLSDSFMQEYSMIPNNNSAIKERSTSYEDISRLCVPAARASKSPLSSNDFIAKCQGTSLPILPVHTDEEKELYLHLMKTHPQFTQGNFPDFNIMSRMFSQKNKKIKLYYNTSSHIRAYFNLKHDSLKFKATCNINPLKILEVTKDPHPNNRGVVAVVKSKDYFFTEVSD